MKKMFTRIAACSLAVLIAFNMVAIPKSKAVGAEVVGTAALAGSTLAAYMTATGVPLSVVSGGAAAASAGAASLISGYAAATGGTYSVVTTAIASGVTIGAGGVIVVGVVAAALLAGVVAWAINEYNIEPDNELVSVSIPSDFILIDGTQLEIHLGDMPMRIEDYCGSLLEIGSSYTFKNGTVWNFAQVDSGDYFLIITYPDGTSYNAYPVGIHEGFLAICEDISTSDFRYHLGLYSADGERFSHQSANSAVGLLGFSGEAGIRVASGYEPLPALAPLEQIELAPNFAPEIAPEAVPDAIFEKIAGNDFDSSYRIVPVTNPEPDPDPEPDPEPNVGVDLSGILDWLKRIWDTIKAIPQAIADKFAAFPQAIAEAVGNLFVPDAALTTEITDTFSEKFAFVPQLHQLGLDLLNLKPDSEPPVIYIHLEDAEGTIDYGGTVKALDMSWYERYKEDGDRIIGGFLWLGFLWMCFMRVSDIINGAGMAYVAGQPTIYAPEPPHDAPRLEAPRKRGKR